MFASMVEPICAAKRNRVVEEVSRYRALVEQEFAIAVPEIAVYFDLIGKAAGMYCRKRNTRYLRFNPYLFAKYWHDNYRNTIAHEVAHYAADLLFSPQKIRPHGRQWQAVMRFFGVPPATTCNFDLTGIPTRKVRRYNYYCLCTTHQLTAIRHNRVVGGLQRYVCRQCASELVALC